MTTAHAEPLTATGRRPFAPSPSSSGNVVGIWAGVGVMFLLLIAYLYGRWALSDDFRPAPTGPSPIPDWMLFTVRATEVAAVAGVVAVLYLVVYRPYRRDGRLSFDGLFALAAGTLWWQDALQNYTSNIALYNTHFLDFGSWYQFVPGWLPAKAENFAEPVLYAGLWYLTFLILLIRLINVLMGKVHARHPTLSRWRMLVVACGIGFVADLIIDPIYLKLGLYTYASAIEPLTLFHGNYYQFPVYYALPTALWLGTTASLRYFMDDTGRSIVEQGADSIEHRPRSRTFVRWLALVGTLNALFLVLYNIPLIAFALHPSTYPDDIQKRSYFTAEMCGMGTDYACPGESIPLNQPASLHVAPDGELIAPPGTPLPTPVPIER